MYIYIYIYIHVYIYIYIVNVRLSSRNHDYAQEMMDDLRKQNDIAREITDTLAAPVGFTTDDDDVRCTNIFHIA